MLVARSSPECHLYIELHPCACGETRFAPKHRTEARGEALISVYEGPCGKCGETRRFELRLAEALPPPPPAFGGETPSTILDAGEFLHAADQIAQRVPGDLTRLTPHDLARAHAELARAAAALDEVLKLIPPGYDHVPAASITSEAGRAILAAEPGRFRRARLEAVRDTYRGMLTAW